MEFIDFWRSCKARGSDMSFELLAVICNCSGKDHRLFWSFLQQSSWAEKRTIWVEQRSQEKELILVRCKGAPTIIYLLVFETVSCVTTRGHYDIIHTLHGPHGISLVFMILFNVHQLCILGSWLAVSPNLWRHKSISNRSGKTWQITKLVTKNVFQMVKKSATAAAVSWTSNFAVGKCEGHWPWWWQMVFLHLYSTFIFRVFLAIITLLVV